MSALYFQLFIDNRPKGKKSESWIRIAKYAESLGLGEITGKGFRSTSAMSVKIKQVTRNGKAPD